MKLKDMHDALVDRLTVALPWAVSVEAYPDWRDAINTPAISIEYDDSEKTMQNGTQQETLNMRWYARVVVGREMGELAVRERGIALSLALSKLHSLGDGCSPIVVVRESPDEFRAPIDGYLVRLVEFEFEAQFGRYDGLMGEAAEAADQQDADMRSWLAGDEVVLRVGHPTCPIEAHDSLPMREL